MRGKGCAAALVGAICATVLCGCGEATGSEYRYDDAASYEVGGATFSAAEIDAIEVDWTSGSVAVRASAEATEINLSETSERTEEEYALRYRLQDKKLTVKFVKSGAKIVADLKKSLVIEIPAEKTLSSAEIETVSAEIKVSDLITGALEAESASGEVSVLGGSYGKVSAESVSGDILVGAGEFGTVETETTSGDITFENGIRPETLKPVGSFQAVSVSGTVDFRMYDAPNGPVTIQTVSGDAEVLFFTGAGFTLTFRTTSGSVVDQFDCAVNGNVYTTGDGHGAISVSTTSGDLKIKRGINVIG